MLEHPYVQAWLSLLVFPTDSCQYESAWNRVIWLEDNQYRDQLHMLEVWRKLARQHWQTVQK